MHRLAFQLQAPHGLANCSPMGQRVRRLFTLPAKGAIFGSQLGRATFPPQPAPTVRHGGRVGTTRVPLYTTSQRSSSGGGSRGLWHATSPYNSLPAYNPTPRSFPVGRSVATHGSGVHREGESGRPNCSSPRTLWICFEWFEAMAVRDIATRPSVSLSSLHGKGAWVSD